MVFLLAFDTGRQVSSLYAVVTLWTHTGYLTAQEIKEDAMYLFV